VNNIFKNAIQTGMSTDTKSELELIVLTREEDYKELSSKINVVNKQLNSKLEALNERLSDLEHKIRSLMPRSNVSAK
jgi:hypothetical protein